MFVKSNSVKEIKKYFDNTLADIYPENEIKNMLFLLFDHHKGWSKIEMRSNENSFLSESELLLFHNALKRLLNHEPIQHIVGSTEFYSLPFNVSNEALIPRPETEELVDLILKENETCGTVLDIGTGTGCIAIAIKKNAPNAKVIGLDVSKSAVKIAKSNAKLNDVEIQLIQSDILCLDSLDEIEKGKINVIVSNPPYITLQEQGLMHENVLGFEPHLALFVPDENPLLFYKRIGELAFEKLEKNGKLYFEINENYAQKTLKLLKSIGFSDIRVIKDLQNKDRIIATTK